MKTYQYTSPENNVVAVIDEDGISRMSMLAELVPEGEAILPYVTPPAPVPQSVTMRQGREMLIRQGLFAQVDAAINAIPDPMEKAIALNYWEKSQVMERDNAVVLQLAPVLGLTDAQLDAMFIQASQL